jgi:hypothetical protein
MHPVQMHPDFIAGVKLKNESSLAIKEEHD